MSMDDQTVMDVFGRARGACLQSFDTYLEFTVREMAWQVESPIELLLGSVLWFNLKTSSRKQKWATAAEFDQAVTEYDLVLAPQYPAFGYRFDFAFGGILLGAQRILIECDGHDFHERTKEQAARDRAKDRIAQINGATILRFTGSEIHRDPSECCLQIVQAALSKRVPE